MYWEVQDLSVKMITSPDQGLSNIACNLLSLPEHILLEALKYIDVDGLCALAQTCRVFFHLAGTRTGLGISEVCFLDPCF